MRKLVLSLLLPASVGALGVAGTVRDAAVAIVAETGSPAVNGFGWD